ncbi:MAG TPA: serine hydrolase [Nocardioides sp.]|uniref:serine hydrolase domain-containing protein n=1 Tax=Nocardioides sp. TaxID=35761 RepID=UPI002C902D56|nr:serine hydrolase [Nocardioides sp.]HQR28208.1 serine hydrolase [Nocardioides sp.]
MRLFRRILVGLLLLVVVALVAGYWYERPLLLTGTGYAAHNACAVEHVAGRDDPEDDLPPNPLVPYLRTKDVGDDGVQASILGVFAKQTAWYTPGFGCTLADERPDLGTPTEVDASANPFSGAPAPTPSPQVEAALARAFGDDLPADEREDLGTRAVVVVRDGELVAERYADGFDADTPQLGWSMTKSVTNLLLGRLVQLGQVAITDDHLRPEWTDSRADITVTELAQMTSGLKWDETYDLGTPITQMLYREQDMGSFVASQPAEHDPGTYQQYSSGSTTLLCAILTERTGVAADLPRRELFAPLGLSSAVLEPDASGTPVCSSYLWATPRDWAAVGQLALQDGEWNGERLLPREWMAGSTTAVDVETEDDGYAAGWWANARPDGTLVEPSLPADAYFAEGHDGQWIVVVPSADLVVVRLGFSPEVDDVGAVRLAADLLAAEG